MIHLKSALTFLRQQPEFGVACGFGSSQLLHIRSFITDENTLKVVAGLGVYFGMTVAALTIVLKCLEIGEKLRTKFKRKI